MSATVILNGDQVYTEELVRENARLTVQVEAERQHRRELEAALARLKMENEALSSRAEQAEGDLGLVAAGLEQEKVLASKLDQAIHDLHFVMADGDACTVCKNKCLMGTADACEPRWKGLDD
jgi:phage shock protein A